MAEAARKFGVAEQPLYREAPNNIEAEQALLGAILVNNDAFYRVSDFLKAGHFYEPLHRKIFEVAAELIRMGKVATPITLKTFLPADEKVGDMTVAQYVVRLAVEAVTVVNATDYGRAIYDLATRRALITVGEDMVNIAYDAPVDMAPSVRPRHRHARSRPPHGWPAGVGSDHHCRPSGHGQDIARHQHRLQHRRDV
jgi:replicative DNA helicase